MKQPASYEYKGKENFVLRLKKSISNNMQIFEINALQDYLRNEDTG